MSSSCNRQGFATHAMPHVLWAAHSLTTRQAASECQDSNSCQFTLHQRRMSSYGTSSNRRRAAARCLPFASITGEHAGHPVGQLRWLSTSSSSKSQQPADPQPQQTQQGLLQDPQQQQQQLDRQAFLAAAEAATAPDTFKAGDALAGGRYVLQHKLGSGPIGLAEGMGEGRFTTLWLGSDTASGQQVVLKLMESGDAVSYSAGAREASLHALAGRHVNVVPLLDAFEHRTAAGRHACMVTQRQGSALDYAFEAWRQQQLNEARQTVSPRLEGRQAARPSGGLGGSAEGLAALRSTARQLLQALDHLHTRGLAHMDLSMDNVLLDKPFLTDVESVAASGFGNLLHSAWHALLEKLGSKSSQQKLQQQLSEASRDSSSYYTRSTLHSANLKLTDFGRAVPFKQLAAQQDALSVDQSGLRPPWDTPNNSGPLGPGVSSQTALAYNPDGMVVMADPTLRPPEEILGLQYAAPPYDVWRLGCLLSELAVGVPLFTIESWAAARAAIPGLQQYSDDAIHLMQMQARLAAPQRELIRKSPLFDQLFSPSDVMRVSKVLELPPNSASVNKELARAAHGFAETAEVKELQSFITSMLVYDPAERPSAAELLQHKFLQQQQQQQQQQQK